MKEQKFIGSLVGAILALGTVVWGSHELFFSRWEGDDLRTELRDGLAGIRHDLTELTKALLAGRRSASAKSISKPSKQLTLQKPEAEPGSSAYFQSYNEIRRKSGQEFWLKNFGEEPDLVPSKKLAPKAHGP